MNYLLFNNPLLVRDKEKNINLEFVYISFLLLFSFISKVTLVAFLFFLLVFLVQKEIGAIKIINILTMRTIINPGIAVNIEQVQNIKWIILFLCSFYLIGSFSKTPILYKIKVERISILILIFAVYNIITAFVFSSLPIVAVFKMISYSIVFLGILIGIAKTFNSFDWIQWMTKFLFLIVGFSIILIPLPLGYFTNNIAFQVLTSNPNMLGITLVLFIAILFSYSKINTQNNFIMGILFIIAFTMILLSDSRTSLIACSVLIFLFIILTKLNPYLKMVYFSFGSIFIILLFITDNNIVRYLKEFIEKGNQESIFFSRTNQIEGLLTNFLENPFFGTGFAVPNLAYRSFEFSSQYVVEPGNLIVAVLSYSGIFGMIIFLIYILSLIVSNIKNFNFVIFLPLSAILISFGEMVFFSSNSIGVFCYMFLAIYLCFDYTEYREYHLKEIR